MASTIRESVTPIKSESDDRAYRSIVLSNGMQLLLISDPTTDKSAAAVAVNVGSLSDPTSALGLQYVRSQFVINPPDRLSAHPLLILHNCSIEHFLFMGSSKYPNEAEYTQFISQNGGSSNAWTAADTTVYYFDIATSSFEPALDRLSDFFKAPLFAESSVLAELNAIQSEHDKNILNDSWQQYELLRQVIKPNHPMAQFHTGTLETLRETPKKLGLNIRNLVIEYTKKSYSSNIMKAVLLGKENLDELESYAVKHFQPIPNFNVTVPTFDSDILQDKCAVIERCPVKQQRSVSLTWVLPSDWEYPQTMPLNIISYCLGDEGAGSLLSLLKALRLATSLSSGRLHQLTNVSSMQVTIGLTELGLTKINDIIRLTYAYIDMMNKASDEKWGKLCKQIQSLDAMQFRFKEKQDVATTTTTLIGHLFRYAPEHVVENENLYHEINLDHIRFFLKHFTLDNMVTVISTPDVTRDVKLLGDSVTHFKGDYQTDIASVPKVDLYTSTNKMDQIPALNAAYDNKIWSYDEYYQMKFSKYTLSNDLKQYTVTGITPEDLKLAIQFEPATYAKFTHPDESLSLPAENPFIPTNFDLLPFRCSCCDQETAATKSFSLNPEIENMPLCMKQVTDDSYKASVLSLEYLQGQCTFVPPQEQMSLDEYKVLIKQLVNDNLIGFDRDHINLSVEEISNKDLDDYETITTQLFHDLGKDLSVPPQIPPIDDFKEAVGAQTMNDDHDAPAASADDDMNDGEEDGEEEDHEDGSEHVTVPKLFTVDTYLSRPDQQAVEQMVPPSQVAVPLPACHFPLSTSTTAISAPILPPIETWYKFTAAYKAPKVDLRVLITFKDIPFTFLILYVTALNDILAETLYPATLCGVQFEIHHVHNGISITVSGHRESSAATLIKIIECIRAGSKVVDEDALKRQCDKVLRSLRSIGLQGAIQQCVKHSAAFLSQNTLHFEEMLELFIAESTDLQKYENIFANTRKCAKFAVFGNIGESYVIRLAQSLAVGLNFTEVSSNDVSVQAGSIVVPQGSNDVIVVDNGNQKDAQNALINYYMTIEPFRTGFARTRNLIQLAQKFPAQYTTAPKTDEIVNANIFKKMTFYGNIIYNYFISCLLSDFTFDTLRTKQQLGYIIFSQHYYSSSCYGLSVLAQSGKSTPYVDSRIEQFLREEVCHFFTRVPNGPEAAPIRDTKCFINSLIGAQTGLLAKFSNLAGEASFFNGNIFSNCYDFARPVVLSLLLPYLSRTVLLSFYQHFYRSLLNRRKLSVHVTEYGVDKVKLIQKYNQYFPQNVIINPKEALSLKFTYPSSKY